MPFIHNETNATAKVLQYIEWKWTYVDEWLEIAGHLKQIWMEDRTFNLEKIPWKAEKLTCKWVVNVKESDKLVINGDTYIVQAVKICHWITLDTTKILLVKW
jgi:hypothetical protein